MTPVELLQPILEPGLQRNNFFNGRLLSAEDLRAEQEAARTQQRHLANAAGDGVSWGLQVSIASVGPASPRVLVRKGVALTRLGDVLSLENDAEVTLVPSSSVFASAEGLFAECRDPASGGMQTVNPEGAYVLVIAPASGYRGTALVSDPNSTAAGLGACGARYSVEGVRFRLVPIRVGELEGMPDDLPARIAALLPPADPPRRERLRNLLAHACYGTEALRTYFRDPLVETPEGEPRWNRWGILDLMRDRGDLTDCDVPLSLVVLTAAGISYVDLWSVRRKLVDQEAVAAWRAVAGPRRLAEAEAAFLQFQAQLEIVRGLAPSLPTVVASTYFDVLPPGGWLPLGTGGFDWKTFLGPHAPPEETPVDAALLRGVIERSWFLEAFRFQTGGSPVPLRVYRVPGEAFVVFARSESGSIRVTLIPAPTANEALNVVATAGTGEHRRSTTRTGARIPIPDLTPGQHTVSATSPDYQDATATAVVVGGRTVDVTLVLAPKPNGTILVSTVDSTTTESIAEKVTSVLARGGGVALEGARDDATGKWLISNLPNGTYTIEGEATGYDPISTPGVGPVTRGEQATALLVFTPQHQEEEQEEEDDDRKEPPRCVGAELKTPSVGRVELCLILAASEFDEDYFYGERSGGGNAGIFKRMRVGDRNRARSSSSGESRHTAAGGQIVYRREPWEEMELWEDPPERVRKWLIRWRDWFAAELRDERIGNDTPLIFFDADYRPATSTQTVRKRPGGYAVFRGFAVPLSIKLESMMTRGEVELSEVEISGTRKRELEEICEKARICYLDDLAAAWIELVEDVLPLPPEVIRHIIADSVKAVAKINEELGYYTGMNGEVRKDLVELGINDDVALANADRQRLGEKLKDHGLARRLIYEARAIAPEESWKLDDMGFADAQVQDFEARGIDSKGILAERATRSAGRAEIAEVAGIANQPASERDRSVKTLVNDAVVKMAEGSIALKAGVSVYTLETLDRLTATKLGDAGYTSVESVGSEEPQVLAEKIGVTVERAEAIVADAQGAGRGAMEIGAVAPVTKAEEARLNGMFAGATGKATIGDIASMSATDLAPAFNGDVDRANAMLTGIAAGMQAGRP